jgi:hypothetical protein
MRRNDVKYWERRAAQQTYDYMERAEDLARDLARIYQKASVWITEQSNRIFEKYRSKYGLTEKKARALLTKIITQPDIDRLINVMEGFTDDLIGRVALEFQGRTA